MYIEPNSIIKFLRAVPLDTTYEHTIYWQSASAQRDYFSSKTAFTFDRLSYQRANSGKMKVAIKPEALYNCNYLMFQNTSFGSKWFYAFITSVDYISNTVSEVSYVIDFMQTWFFDYQLGQNYIERQHTVSDNIGEHRLSEGFDIGQYLIMDSTSVTADEVYTYSASNTADGGAPVPKIIDGMPTNLYFSANKNSDTTIRELQQFNDNGYADSIISAYVSTGSESKTVNAPARGSRTYGYTPKNKKLLTYPYVKLVAVSPNGTKMDFSYEDSDNTETPEFKYKSIQFPTPCWILYPSGYRNISNDVFDGLVDSTVVTIGTSGDTFKAYTAQATSYGARKTIKEKTYSWLEKNVNAGGQSGWGSKVNDLISSGISAAAGFIGYAGRAISSFASGSAAGVGSAILGNVAEGVHAMNEPDQVLTSATSSGMIFNLGLLGEFRIFKETLIPEQARSIDDYFTRFGYAVRQTTTPNRNARPHWTYIKTIGCVINGNCPADIESAICSVYDKGITFWNNPDEVGNYSLDNSPR